MPYVGSDGRVAESRSPWRFSIITDILVGVYDFVALFLRAVFNPPSLEGGGSNTSYGERHQGRSHRSSGGGGAGRTTGGSNIRGLKNLQGSTQAPAGGG
eukprot:CAMPEP_0119007210 /NCGR_PEP_ID=MMETSP1176-20130426/2851_1 /TAXON_ID=265551 /ORGANISM="Synedropsis recta cf, Strain CCMP1620" /LENGTH=98 /DNA_ID=CAMNT_0006959313 /DNA_START=73 /DNA_END=369 /DNA_ORIENTATION=-